MERKKRKCKLESCTVMYVQFNSLDGGYHSNKCRIEGKGKPKPIKQLSDKRADENKGYLEKREKHLKENPNCQIPVEGCTKKAKSVHHSKGRLGKLLTDERYFKSACDNCHDWAERHPDEAKEKGYSFDRLTK